MGNRQKKEARIGVRALKKEPGRQAPRGLSPADLRRFCGILSKEEAEKMIRDIEEAFEQPD